MYQAEMCGKPHNQRCFGLNWRIRTEPAKAKCTTPFKSRALCTIKNERSELVRHQAIEFQGFSGGSCVVDFNHRRDGLSYDVFNFHPGPGLDGGGALQAVG